MIGMTDPATTGSVTLTPGFARISTTRLPAPPTKTARHGPTVFVSCGVIAATRRKPLELTLSAFCAMVRCPYGKIGTLGSGGTGLSLVEMDMKALRMSWRVISRTDD